MTSYAELSEPIRILDTYPANGLIHVGANDGYEFKYYKEKGIPNLVGFEPLIQAFVRFHNEEPDILKFHVGWGDVNELKTINVFENDKSSSVLPTIEVEDPEKHEVFKDWNIGQMIPAGQDTIQLMRYEDFMRSKPYNPEDFDVLVIDIQGYELKALQGMGSQLDYFDLLVVECSAVPVYVGEPSAQEVIDWLDKKGFDAMTPPGPHTDILFIRRDDE